MCPKSFLEVTNVAQKLENTLQPGFGIKLFKNVLYLFMFFGIFVVSDFCSSSSASFVTWHTVQLFIFPTRRSEDVLFFGFFF